MADTDGLKEAKNFHEDVPMRTPGFFLRGAGSLDWGMKNRLARIFNPIIQGWINYYGRFYRSMLIKVLRRINAYLVRWAMGKYKRLRRYPAKARRFLVDVFRRQPGLFAHWRFGVRPDGWTMGAR